MWSTISASYGITAEYLPEGTAVTVKLSFKLKSLPLPGAVTVAANPAVPLALVTSQINLYFVPATNVTVSENVFCGLPPVSTCSPVKVPPSMDHLKLSAAVACSVWTPDSVGV